MDYDVRYFGPIDMDNPGHDYDSDIKWQGEYLRLALMLSGNPITADLLDNVEILTDRIGELDAKCRRIIEAETMLEDGGKVGEFAAKVLEKLPKEHHPRIIDENEPSPIYIQVMRKMEFNEVCFEPEEENAFVSFTYCLDWTLTHCTFNIYFNSKGEFQSIYIYGSV